jgi:hypothetical protein
MKVYGYEIFNVANFILSVIGYLTIYFGYNWYMDALSNHGDLLNGGLLMGIGALVLSIVIYMNIKNTSLLYGLIMSMVTEILYCLATPIVFFALLLAVAYFSQTKPVYNIND